MNRLQFLKIIRNNPHFTQDQKAQLLKLTLQGIAYGALSRSANNIRRTFEYKCSSKENLRIM